MTTTQQVSKFARYEGNPIITPDTSLPWQKRAVFNPAAIFEDGKVHIVYRAQSELGISVFGYAASSDGLHIDDNLTEPIYIPRESFEITSKPGTSTGCKDPRLTKINDRLYLTYAAYDGINPPRIALSSIRIADFLAKKWLWDRPKLISPPGIDDKDACVVKNVSGDGFLVFHRFGNTIWIDILPDLEFSQTTYISGNMLLPVRRESWDNIKLGIAAPPLATEHGWLLLYHAACEPGFLYKVGAVLLSYDNPRMILARTDEPLLEPEAPYELHGNVDNVIFPGGAVVINDTIYLYYGCANTVVSVATMPLQTLINTLIHHHS